jgi:hypothetical protein
LALLFVEENPETNTVSLPSVFNTATACASGAILMGNEWMGQAFSGWSGAAVAGFGFQGRCGIQGFASASPCLSGVVDAG